MNLLKIAVALALTVSGALGQAPTPQGRLTLQSNTPVMTSDVVGATTLYYTPYVGNIIPTCCSGTGGLVNTTMSSQLSVTLNAGGCNLTAGSVYDVFATSGGSGVSSSLSLSVGPAWASATSRNSSYLLELVDGLWVNASNISTGSTCPYDGGMSVTRGTYVGSIYMTANGETTVNLKPCASSSRMNRG
jgi:hypothetical protein